MVWRGLEIRIVPFVASNDGEEDITKAARQVLEGSITHIDFFRGCVPPESDVSDGDCYVIPS